MPRLAILLLIACAALAQDSRARIVGLVTDSTGAAVPGVEVRATNTATAVTSSGRTNESGNYEIPFLPPGVYDVSAEFTGFKKFQRAKLELRVNDRSELDITLSPGEVTETVTVSATTSFLETATSSIGQVVDHKRLSELPLSGGNPFTLTRLTPGVTYFGAPNHPNLGPAVEVVSNIAVSGTRDHNTEYSVDGTPSMWGRNASFVPPADLVQEFKVQTSTYDASVGHSPGGAVNVTLKGGTNRFSGTMYNFHNNNKLQGMDFFQRRVLYDPSTGPVTKEKRATVAPAHVINRYGFTFGGPVWIPRVYDGRNRTFWIYGYEGLIRPTTERGNYFYNVPTAAQRNGDFSALLAVNSRYQIFDPATTAPAPAGRFSRQPFPGNVIPRARLNATSLSLLQFFPDANQPGTADFRNNFFRPPKSQNEFYSSTNRVDHNYSERHRMFGRYTQTHNLFASGQVLPSRTTGTDRHRYNKGASLDDVFVFSPSFIMNLRYGFSWFKQTFDPLTLEIGIGAANFPASLVAAIPATSRVFPQYAIDGLQTLGAYGSAASTNYHVGAADFTKTRGSHSIRFGGEYRLMREHNYNFNQETPRLDFAATYTNGPLDNAPPAPTGQGLASFLLGIPTGGGINVNASSAEQSHFAALYIHDDWKVSPRLTLNLGIRYELETSLTERFNRTIVDYDFRSANPIDAAARANYAAAPIPQIAPADFRSTGGLRFAGVGGVPRNVWPADKNNWSPRIGFAYQMSKSMVVRGGYGIFFVPYGVDRESVNQSGYTQRTNLNPSNDNGQTFIASITNPFPGGVIAPSGNALGLATDTGRAISFFNPGIVNGYMQRWSLGVQKEALRDLLFDLSYVGSRGTKLSTNRQFNAIPQRLLSTSPVRDQATVDFLSTQVSNPYFPLLPGTGLANRNVSRAQLLLPYPHFTGITADEPRGYSWYHSMQFSAQKRYSRGFTTQVSYTWSKYMEASGYLTASDASLEEVISDQDRPHRVAFSGIWELPVGRKSTGWKRQVLGGWQLQGIWEWQSGAPIGFGNSIFTGDIRAVPRSGADRTVDRWFNIEGFERDSAKQLANNVRRFSTRFTGIRTQEMSIWNISAIKEFPLRERMRLQLRSEWLNALNRSHFVAPNTAPVNTLFGTVNNTNGFPKQVYFALKLIF